ncbi:MAG: DUF3817 domain-containing protein [Actinobacteria bacterium]|nr:DUF3817 domain-containing protein [Actinomycetota bacterium]
MSATTPRTTTAPPDGAIRLFRIIATAEAISWGALLIAMVFKYAVAHNAIGVRVVGPIHGTFFLVYLVTTIVVGKRCGWPVSRILLGLFAAVPPFATLWFERWAERNGHLEPATATAGA